MTRIALARINSFGSMSPKDDFVPPDDPILEIPHSELQGLLSKMVLTHNQIAETVRDAGILRKKEPSKITTKANESPKPPLVTKIGPLPMGEELIYDAEHPEAQPHNPGIVLYITDFLKDGFCACRCTRNLHSAEKWIANQGGKIIVAYPVHGRDGQGRRLGRCIRHSVSELGGNATTFYFKYDGAAKNFLNQISMQKANDFKSVRQALKALVRNAISTIAQKTGSNVMSVKDIVAITLSQVDGLSISTYLDWLMQDKVIFYHTGASDILNQRIKLLV
jgi:hypothetical protein